MSPTEEDIVGPLQGWVGRSFRIHDEITLPAVRRIAATFDLDGAAFGKGSEIPPQWYSMFFPMIAPQSQIGHDGHPRKGDFLPPIPLPRRMFVGRRVQFPGVLRVGDEAVKQSEVVAITQKNGRSGRLVFLTMRHTVEVNGKAVVIEDQDAVYRDGVPEGMTPAAAPPQPAPDASWREAIVMDPVLVFRYSALSWNGHRIHYDVEYARNEEGYPACVMNGALTLHLVVAAALRQAGGRPLTGMSARMVKPLFVGDKLHIGGTTLNGGAMQAWAADETGALSATTELRFA